MYSDSRKSARNSFAHHRAHLLFLPKQIDRPGTEPVKHRPFPLLTDRTAIVRGGLSGFAGAA
jgi:hypothetical protein